MRARRARSPLRWLWVVTGSLGILALAGATGQLWLLAAIPIVVLLLLFAPPIGVFRHDEITPPRTGARLEWRVLPAGDDGPPGARRFLLTLVNDGEVAATDFRIRILIPAALWPRGTRGGPLDALHCGEHGRHWFVESVHDDTSVTFRAGSIACPAGGRIELAELVLVNLPFFEGNGIEYQLNGGTVSTVLGKLELPTSAPTSS